MNLGWPTDDLEAENARAQPSKLRGNIVKRKALPTLKKSNNKQLNNDSDSNDDEYDQYEYDDDIKHTNKKQKNVEVTSTKKVSTFKVINDLNHEIGPKKIKAIDPRFMSYAGEYDRKQVAQNYEFIDEMRQEEVNELKKHIKKIRKKKSLSEEQEKLKRQLQSTETKLRVAKARKEKDTMLTEYRAKAKEMAKQGIVPQLNKVRLEKEIGAAKEFLSLSGHQVEKRLKHKRERKINKDYNLIKHTKQK